MKPSSKKSDSQNPSRLEIGVFVGVHGIKGQLKLKSMTETPKDFLEYGDLFFADGTQVPKIKIHGEAKGSLIISMTGLRYRDEAEKLKGKSLYINADALPEPEEDEFYASDLEGLQVISETDERLGTVKAMLDFGAGELLEIADTNGQLAYYPFTLAVFPDIDLTAQTIRLIKPDEVISQDEDGGVH